MEVSFLTKNRDDSKEYYANAEAIRSLFTTSTLDMPIAPICIVGQYRGGKSTALDFFIRYLEELERTGVDCANPTALNRMEWMMKKGKYIDGFVGAPVKTDGFAVAPGTERVSVGISIWRRLFIINNSNVTGGKMAVMLIDTQGLWDPHTPNRMNCSVFGNCCMLSSYVIINQKGVISSELMAQLNILSKFTKTLKIDSDNKLKLFQHMNLLNRDNTDIPINGNLNDCIDVSQKMMKLLDSATAFEEHTKQLKTCFREIDAFCLPTPGSIDAKGYDGSIDKISPLFMQSLGYYIEQVVRNVRPRMLNDVPMTGAAFCKFAIECAKIFKDQDVFPDTNLVMRMLESTYHRYDGYDLEHNDKEHKTTVKRGNTVVAVNNYRVKESHKDAMEEVYDGFWQQNVYKQIKNTILWERCDGTLHTEYFVEKVFDHKKPRPSYPMAPFDCTIMNVYTDKYHSKHNYYNDVPLMKGERLPKQLDQGHGWVFYIGDAFPLWNCRRTGGNRTQYHEWSGQEVEIQGYGRIRLTW